MTRHPDTAYHFATEAQWQSGIGDNLELIDGILGMPTPLHPQPVDGTGPADSDALVTSDGAGALYWLRPSDRSLRRSDPHGVIEVGIPAGPAGALDIAIAGGRLWVLTKHGIERHLLSGLERLGLIEPHNGRTFVAIAADGIGGIWALETNTDCASTLRHFDCWGIPTIEPITIPDEADQRSRMAATAGGTRVVVLFPGRARSLYAVDVCATHQVRPLPFRSSPAPISIDIDAHDRLLLLSWDECEESAWLEVAAFDGEVEGRHRLNLPDGFGSAKGLAASVPTGIVGAGGLAHLQRSTSGAEARVSTFVTPTLISLSLGDQPTTRSGPPRSGWHRAEVEAVLPRGSSLEITWATSDSTADAEIADGILRNSSLAPNARLAELERRLSWPAENRVVYEAGRDGQSEAQQLAALIDRPDHRYLWLRLTLRTVGDGESPNLAGLRVRYPAQSYIEELPAIYQDDPVSAAQLRRVLTPFEMLFDSIDECIDELPSRIDPATAPDDWTAMLLRWLGMPVLDDLPADRRSALLREAPRLLSTRGTHGALQRALEIVTGASVRVTDHSAETGAWFLPQEGSKGGARLGVDTVVAAQQPASFLPGSAVLGRSPLGVGCTDPVLVLAERSGLVEIRIELEPADAERIRPIVDRMVAVFVPAHCRLVIDDTPGVGPDRTHTLDVDFRLGGDEDDDTTSVLHSDANWRLGATTELGSWQLPSADYPLAVLDETVVSDGLVSTDDLTHLI